MCFNIFRTWWKNLPINQDRTMWIKGGHCGLCGKWLQDAIVDANWPWSICPDWETECFDTSSSTVTKEEEENE